MAQRKTLGSLLVRLGMDPRDADNAIKKFEKSLKEAGKRMEATGKAMSVGFTAPFLFGIGKAIQAFDEEAQVTRKLQIALGGTSKALLDQAAALQKTTTFADDQIITQQAWAAALGHSEAQIKDMTEAAVGASAALGIGLDSAMEGLHKTTLGVPGALGKVIPEIKNLSEEQLKAGKAIDIVKEKFAGFAEAAALTGTGPIKMLQNSFGDLMEQIGEAALPIVVAFTQKIRDLITAFQEMDPETKRAIVAWGGLVAAIGPLLVLLPKIIKLFAILTSEVALVVAGIAALGLVAVYVSKNWETFSTIFQTIWFDIKSHVVNNINEMLGWINKLIVAMNVIGKTNISMIPTVSAPKIPESKPYTGMQSPGEFFQSVGNDIWGLLGGNSGQAMIDGANAKLDAMAEALGGVGLAAEVAGKRVKIAVAAIGGINTNSNLVKEANAIWGGLANMSFGQTNAFSKMSFEDYMRFDPSARVKGAISDMGKIQPDLTGATAEHEKALDSYISKWEKVGDVVSGAMSQISSDLQAGVPMFAALGKAALNAAAEIIKAALATTAANAVAKSSIAGIPGIIIGFAAATAAVTALQSLIGKINAPKLARGGAAYGPMQAVIGDNPNAHYDPELVAPVSKLAGMLGGKFGGNGGGVIEVRIKNRELSGAINQINSDNNRMLNPTVTSFNR